MFDECVVAPSVGPVDAVPLNAPPTVEQPDIPNVATANATATESADFRPALLITDSPGAFVMVMVMVIVAINNDYRGQAERILASSLNKAVADRWP